MIKWSMTKGLYQAGMHVSQLDVITKTSQVNLAPVHHILCMDGIKVPDGTICNASNLNEDFV